MADKQKWVIVSYNTEEQQAFFDVVPAETEEEATALVDTIRPYAVILVDVTCDTRDFLQMAERIHGMPIPEAEEWLCTIAEEVNGGGCTCDVGPVEECAACWAVKKREELAKKGG